MSIDTTTRASAQTDEERAEQLAQTLLGQFGAGVELLTVELGRRLGLYEALAGSGAVTADELSARASIAPRYAEEWLDQQAAAGILDVVSAEPRRFALPDGHAAVLVAEESPAHLVGAAPLLLGVATTLRDVADAYATGRGVEYAAFGDELRFGIASINRPGFTHETRAWVETLPDVAARLDRGGIVLDAGCGEGWSTIGLARAFPAARVVGVDLDARSVEEARRHVEDTGLVDRVEIVRANAADPAALRDAARSPVTLVTVYQALHDMGEPVEALRAFRGLLATGGAVLVADEHGEDERYAPADEVERLKLSMSVLHCLPATWAESSSVVNGTVLRPGTLRRWVAEAGFERFEVLPVEHPFWRFHRLG
ncbi:class I SAM-dependent methyltransferase [Nocardioides sp. MAHUQ-72]|uniref:class I SAM-dependent methyltransferase n=1 Tax=unclassified Nocardioides TaxID=2615069 RepID=UPI00361E09CB